MKALFPAALLLALSGCYVDDDPVAQADLFNRPASKLLTCFGKPDRRIPVGVESIWVYRVGRLTAEGWIPLLGASERPTFTAPSPLCEVRFKVDSHGVRGIAYTDDVGRPLPLAERCDYAVRACVGSKL